MFTVPYPEHDPGSLIVVYHAVHKRPNPGTTLQEKIEACSQACLAKKCGLRAESWEGFVALGFGVDNDGDCQCRNDDSATCKRVLGGTAARYDFIG